MLILIEKDSSTSVPKECTYEQAAAYANDFTVYVMVDDVKVPFAEYVDPEVIEVKPAPKKSAKADVAPEVKAEEDK